MIIDGTTFHEDTPERVAKLLNEAMRPRKASMGVSGLVFSPPRVRLFYGNPETGKDWLENYDVTGFVSRSSGPNKIPILLARRNSLGGPAILTHRILRILFDGRQVYRAENYQAPIFYIRGSEIEDLPIGVYAYGDNVANFATDKQAKRWIDFMTGNRATP